MIGEFLTLVKWLVLTPIYMISSLIPKDERVWVFSQSDGRFEENTKYYFLYLSNKEPDTIPVWLSFDEDLIKKLQDSGYHAYHYWSLQGIFYLFRAKYVCNHSSIEVPWWSTGGSQIIQLWHGNMIKTFGKDLFGHNSLSLSYYIREQIFWDWDYLIQTSKSPLASMPRRMFNINGNKSIVTGYPRTDIFYNNISGYNIGACDKTLDIIEEHSNDSTIILYAPTFRHAGDYRDGTPLGQVDLKIEELNEVLKNNNSYLLIKPHPKSKLDMGVSDSNRIFKVRSPSDVYPIVKHTDLLITDYSSIYIDFLLLDRPIVFFPYDIDEYEETRGLYYDYESITPGHVAYTSEELIEELEDAIQNPDKYRPDRHCIRNLFHKYNDGKSSERIVRSVSKRHS